MARTKTIRLAEGEAPRLTLRFEGAVTHVAVDGAAAGTLSGVRQSWQTTLPDGRVVEVRYLRPFLMPELAVLVDGQHAPDSPSHPLRMLRAAGLTLLFCGIVFVVMALSGRTHPSMFRIARESLQVLGGALLLRRMWTGAILVGVSLAADVAMITLALTRMPFGAVWGPTLGRLILALFLARACIALRDVRDAGT